MASSHAGPDRRSTAAAALSATTVRAITASVADSTYTVRAGFRT
ncbi:hypothetical protein [Leifsonia poae]